MKTHFTFTRRLKNCTLGVFLMLSGWSCAATYTAISSGVWSNASIWAGGVSPGSSVGTLDNVVINSGANVTLDMDVQFSGLLTSLEVNGTLTSTGDYMLDMNNAALSGSGTLTLRNLRFGATGTMTFTGTSSVDNLWNNSISMNLVSQMSVNDTLFLEAGTFNLSTNGALTFESGSVVYVEDGTMTASSGLLNNSNDYSVVYVGTDKNTGLELAGSGLTDVWVNLDNNNQSLSLSQNTSIAGVLHHDQGMIDLNGRTLTLMNDYDAASGVAFMGSASSGLAINHNSSLSSGIKFDNSANELNNLTINITGSNGSANLASDLTVNGELMLENGNFKMTSGIFAMADGSEIIVKDGHMATGGGTFYGDNEYSVTYNGTSSTASGIEITGSGLHDLTFDMEDEADSVKIMHTITLDGALNLDNGGMAMNGYDLTLDGSLHTTSHGWFSGNGDSDINFNTSSLFGDTLWFNSAANTFGNFTINAQDGSDLMIGNNLHVGNINMANGGMQIWDNEIWLNSTGMITGADENKYINIDGTGSLVMNLPVAAPYTMFPVGTDGGYAPVGLQQNSGTAGYFKVNSLNGVWADGLTGIDYALTQTVVNRTWDIHSVNGGSVDLNLMTMWSDAFEVNSFDRTDAYIMHYSNGAWDAMDQTGGAAVAVGSMFQLERENITSLSPFAVRSGIVLGLDENTGIISGVYPNPVQNILNCVVNLDETTTANVSDVTGKVIYTETVKGIGTVNHQIDFSNYPYGVYYVNYTSSKGVDSYKVVKSL